MFGMGNNWAPKSLPCNKYKQINKYVGSFYYLAEVRWQRRVLPLGENAVRTDRQTGRRCGSLDVYISLSATRIINRSNKYNADKQITVTFGLSLHNISIQFIRFWLTRWVNRWSSKNFENFFIDCQIVLAVIFLQDWIPFVILSQLVVNKIQITTKTLTIKRI